MIGKSRRSADVGSTVRPCRERLSSGGPPHPRFYPASASPTAIPRPIKAGGELAEQLAAPSVGQHAPQVDDHAAAVSKVVDAAKKAVSLDDSESQVGITSPAGVFEAFVAEVVESQVDSGSASRQGAPAFRDIAAKHGIEMINARENYSGFAVDVSCT
jgi:hypothetical protein